METGAFHRTSKEALWSYDFLSILIQNHISLENSLKFAQNVANVLIKPV